MKVAIRFCNRAWPSSVSPDGLPVSDEAAILSSTIGLQRRAFRDALAILDRLPVDCFEADVAPAHLSFEIVGVFPPVGIPPNMKAALGAESRQLIIHGERAAGTEMHHQKSFIGEGLIVHRAPKMLTQVGDGLVVDRI